MYNRKKDQPAKIIAVIIVLFVFGLIKQANTDPKGFLLSVQVILGIVFGIYLLKRLFRNKNLNTYTVIDSDQIRLPYRRKDYLLSIAERNFYEVLNKISEENNFLLFAKVRLEDLLWLPSGLSWSERLSFRGRIKSRHIDFVICDRENIRPLLAVELDDSSHEREDRKERDENIDHILHDAGLPILHIPVQQFYNLEEILNQIRNKISA